MHAHTHTSKQQQQQQQQQQQWYIYHITFIQYTLCLMKFSKESVEI